MGPVTIKEFVDKFFQFRKLVNDCTIADEKDRLSNEEQIDLFRLWLGDTRDQEILTKAEKQRKEEEEEFRGF